jgi:hypothetical protein
MSDSETSASTAELGADNLDFAGNPVPRNCENCEGLFDDGDGPEYGPPQPACSIKPHMAHLRPFPFKTPQTCFEIAWWHLVDWDAEGRKMDAEYRASQAHNTTDDRPQVRSI